MLPQQTDRGKRFCSSMLIGGNTPDFSRDSGISVQNELWYPKASGDRNGFSTRCCAIVTARTSPLNPTSRSAQQEAKEGELILQLQDKEETALQQTGNTGKEAVLQQ